jgi:hypothetical protein
VDKEKKLRDLYRRDSIRRGIAIVLSFFMAVVSFYSAHWYVSEGVPPQIGNHGVMLILAMGVGAAWICILNLKGK